ncbi:MAG: ATP-dependent helicase [Spirochaetaceae bacterium]|jgi:DNA helicase-2/ATP-dependent DNA helicase PcrA|nr:ATP-dependent helicase [Spirochaetaceae bacterium]
MQDYLSTLNPEQRAAVEHTGKPLLILAGAGSGKTRVITTKIAYLIREKGYNPYSILAVTFTNKAAREMKERACRIEGRAENAMLRTFHSFGAWFLRRNAEAAGLSPNFTIYDDDDTAALLATIMAGAPKGEVRAAAGRIARAKDYFLDPDSLELPLVDHRKEFRVIYRRYEDRLREIGNVDFGDLIKKPVEILRNNPAIKARIHDRFRVIMVDEYQDANIAQFELLRELYADGAYICVVGDDDQSIYSFRGAEVQNILQFPQKFDGVDTIRLVRNYRSVAPILNLAGIVVNNNAGRLGKELVAERGDGKTPRLVFVQDQDTEAKFCANLVERAVDAGGAYSDWAILYRTNAQSLGFETEFLRRRVPYRVVGSLKFYEREEIKDALALLALMCNPRDEVAFRRVVNKPVRGIGGTTVERVLEQASGVGGDLLAALNEAQTGMTAKARQGVQSFLTALDEARGLLAGNTPSDDDGVAEADGAAEVAEIDGNGVAREKPGKRDKRDAGEKGGKKEKPARPLLKGAEGLSLCVAALAEGSGIAGYHHANDDIKGESRLANLQELVNAASLYPASADGLAEFLEHIELDRSIENAEDNETDMVTLITLHNTKGLEFKKVIMTGVEQGVFPRWDKRDAELEEERRLFYVGVTRAMDELYMTCAEIRRVWGQTQMMEPSVFLHEARDADIKLIGDVPWSWENHRRTTG